MASEQAPEELAMSRDLWTRVGDALKRSGLRAATKTSGGWRRVTNGPRAVDIFFVQVRDAEVCLDALKAKLVADWALTDVYISRRLVFGRRVLTVEIAVPE